MKKFNYNVEITFTETYTLNIEANSSIEAQAEVAQRITDHKIKSPSNHALMYVDGQEDFLINTGEDLLVTGVIEIVPKEVIPWDDLEVGEQGEDHNEEEGVIIHMIDRNSSMEEVWDAIKADDSGLIYSWAHNTRGAEFDQDAKIVVASMHNEESNIAWEYAEGGFQSFK